MAEKSSQNDLGIGVGVILLKGNKLLLGKRKNALQEGTYGFPGGRLEPGETVEECALREVREETGLKVKNARLGPTTLDVFREEGKRYKTFFVITEYDSGEPQALEPHKCDKWEWHNWDEMPEPLFKPIVNLLKQGYHPLK